MSPAVGRRRAGLPLLLIFLIATVAPGPATTIVLDTTAGPYDVSIGASPTPLVAGRNHISILIQEHENGRIVTDAEVKVTASPLDEVGGNGNGAAFQQTATHDQAADARQFATPLSFGKPGRWQLTIDIDGPAGAATTSVQLTVQRDVASLPLVYLMMILIPFTAVALIVYWLRSGGQAAVEEGA